MTDMLAKLERGHALAPIIHAQLDKLYLQPKSLIFSNFNVLQNTVMRALLFHKNLKATYYQSQEHRQNIEERGEGLIQSVKIKEIAYVAKSKNITSLKNVLKSLDQEDLKDISVVMRKNDRALRRYTLLRQHSEATKDINRICHEWEKLEVTESEWRAECEVAADDNLKCYEELKRFRENLGRVHAAYLALLERIKVLRKCDCEEVCMIENYEHQYERKDEWKMGMDGV